MSNIQQNEKKMWYDLYCSWMYWTDWSRKNPRIVRSGMDGSNMQVIVNGTATVHWPNGVTIDHQLQRIYWTDAYLDQICSAELNGSNIRVEVSGTSRVPHPYSIGVFKVGLILYEPCHAKRALKVFLCPRPGASSNRIVHPSVCLAFPPSVCP